MSLRRLLTKDEHEFFYNEYHEFLLRQKVLGGKSSLHDFFELLRQKDERFKRFSDRELTNKIIASRRTEGEYAWPNISNLENYVNPAVLNLVDKAQKAALLAVEIYNKPSVEYRSEGYIVMMNVAWTSLFHAIFKNKNIPITYKQQEDSYIDLRKCINKYNGPLKKEIEANLTLLIELRDQIVHRDNPIIDDKIFGHCQACLMNFEELIVENFGAKYQLNNSLAFSLQFSGKYLSQQYDSIKHYKTRESYKALEFIKEYEDELYRLHPDIFKSPNYCFRIYMIPKIVKERESDAAIEYLKYDLSDPANNENVDKLVCFIRETRVGGNYLKASEVCKIVYDKLKNSKPKNWKFTPSFHHSKCAKFYKIREGYKTENPEMTKQEYCFYDKVFEQYIYTVQWANFLCNKLKDNKLYNQIMES